MKEIFAKFDRGDSLTDKELENLYSCLKTLANSIRTLGNPEYRLFLNDIQNKTYRCEYMIMGRKKYKKV